MIRIEQFPDGPSTHSGGVLDDQFRAVPMDDEDDASGWRAWIKDYYRKLLSPARY